MPLNVLSVFQVEFDTPSRISNDIITMLPSCTNILHGKDKAKTRRVGAGFQRIACLRFVVQMRSLNAGHVAFVQTKYQPLELPAPAMWELL